MKNIHLIQTDKPTGLFESKSGVLHYSIMNKVRTGLLRGYHIYITFDDKVEEVDWVLYGEESVMQVKSSYDNDMSGEDIWLGDSLNGCAANKDDCKKIILTTDQDLISDGVQAIDDEFLEWFVSNPSCEEVETIYGLFNPMGRQVDPNNLGQNHSQCVWKHKIIIPQKRHTIITDWLTENGDPEIDKKVEKQLELEKASWRYNPLKKLDGEFIRQAFKDGAKWMAERRYSEEEVLKLLLDSEEFTSRFNGRTDLRSWFEEFKKK